MEVILDANLGSKVSVVRADYRGLAIYIETMHKHIINTTTNLGGEISRASTVISGHNRTALEKPACVSYATTASDVELSRCSSADSGVDLSLHISFSSLNAMGAAEKQTGNNNRLHGVLVNNSGFGFFANLHSFVSVVMNFMVRVSLGNAGTTDQQGSENKNTHWIK